MLNVNQIAANAAIAHPTNSAAELGDLRCGLIGSSPPNDTGD
jgi:hypothetical protein